MSVWTKLATLIKGMGNEAGEAIVESNQLRILDQEMREAGDEIRRAEESLTKIMGKRKVAENRVAELDQEIVKYEGHARQAMKDGKEELALECANKVAELKQVRDQEQGLAGQFKNSEEQLHARIRKSRKQLKQMEHQIDTVKATDAVHKAQAAVSSRFSGADGKMKTAASSLSSLQKKQEERAAELDAAEQLAAEESGSDLDQRLAEAGIAGGATDGRSELERIMAAQ